MADMGEAGTTAGGATQADGLPQPARAWAMLGCAIAVGMSVLDAAIANIALPAIARDVHADPAASVWVVNAYQLAMVVSLLSCAALGDRLGYRRVFMAGVAVFTVGSLGAALSNTLPTLVAARAVQGLGAAGIASVNTALVRFAYPRARLGQGISMITLTVALCAAAGPSVAAAILSVARWPWLFAVNVPFGVFCFVLAQRAAPYTPRGSHRFDWIAGILNAVSFGALVLAIDALGTGNLTATSVVEFAIALVAGIALVRRELKRPAPLLPVDLLRIPLFALSVVTSICSYAAQTIAYVALPFYFESAAGLSQAQTGLLITPWPFVVVFVAPVAGRLSDRYPVAILGGIGMTLMCAGLLLLYAAPIGAPGWDIAWRMALAGCGFGFFQTPNNRALITSAPPERSGAASGMVSSARLLGQSIGAALVAVAFGLLHPSVTSGAELALLLAVGFAAVGAVSSFLRLGATKAP
jgi:MFS transporter, DHA2 family, multidrug resistance protein